MKVSIFAVNGELGLQVLDFAHNVLYGYGFVYGVDEELVLCFDGIVRSCEHAVWILIVFGV